MSVDSKRGEKLKKVDVTSYKPRIRPCIFEDKVKSKLKKIFKDCNEEVVSYKDDKIDSSTFPFPHCIVNSLMWNIQKNSSADEFVASLCEQLLSMDFNEKSNDLYKFRQTHELMSNNRNGDASQCSPQLQQFCNHLRMTILPWLREITGIPLNDEISMFCAQYASTDCLLCHDDELEHRRIAYVYYLTPDWRAEDGGALDLYDSISEVNGSCTWYDPSTVVKSVVPLTNSFIFFEVSSKSFHKVAEVLTENKIRVSLSGWFHGPPISRPSIPHVPRPPVRCFVPSTSDVSCLSAWISPLYLGLSTQGAIQQQFTEDSEIQLNKFLIVEKFDSLLQSLKLLNEHKNHWKQCGPPSQRSYHQLTMPEQPLLQPQDDSNEQNEAVTKALLVVQECLNVFLSEEMFLYLSNITGLCFHPMASNSDSSEDEEGKNKVVPEKRRKKADQPEPGLNSGCRYEIRHWSHGSHTLLRDTDAERGEYALDLNLYLCQDEWEEEWGGYTSYIANDEAEELLTIVPSGNCLAITYRDCDALRFVKHINHNATDRSFFDFALSYYQ